LVVSTPPDSDARDEELIRNGDFAALLARHRYPITQRVRLKVPERDVEDVVSEIILHLFRDLSSGRTYDAPFGAIVARRTRWAIAEYHARRLPLPDDPPAEEVGSTDPPEVSDYGYVRRLLAELPPGDAKAAKLRFVLGLTPGEIAERLGTTTNAVNQALWRARKRLKEVLDG
jgi:RNA polymerase sigma-70 factor (ECF subfamily)